MPNSRIVLSLLGLFVAINTALAWIALGGERGPGEVIGQDQRSQYLVCGLALFSAISWYLTFFRPRGIRYLVCGRLLLSGLSSVFGACMTLILMEYSALSDAR